MKSKSVVVNMPLGEGGDILIRCCRQIKPPMRVVFGQGGIFTGMAYLYDVTFLH